eukprot:5743135-Pleurochrysis_carterae.AAC.1
MLRTGSAHAPHMFRTFARTAGGPPGAAAPPPPRAPLASAHGLGYPKRSLNVKWAWGRFR